jgi:hypothetical protein
MRTDRLPPIATRCQEETRANHVVARRAELSGGSERSLDRSLGLKVGIALVLDHTVGKRRRTTDCNVPAEPNGAGVRGGLSEAASVRHPLSHEKAIICWAR